MEQGRDVSNCVPIYVNKIPERDHTFSDLKEGEVNIMKITYELVGVLAYPYEWLFVSL